jgi:hypothetical protein
MKLTHETAYPATICWATVHNHLGGRAGTMQAVLYTFIGQTASESWSKNVVKRRTIHRAWAANNFYIDQKAAAIDFLATSDSNYKGNVQTTWEDIGDDINISAKEGLDG